MEVEKVREMMKSMNTMIDISHPTFSVEYLKKMFVLRKKDIRIEKINRIFNE
jgi:hypothetical protein